MKLIKMENGNYQLIDGAVTIEGSWPTIEARMRFEYEIEDHEIERAKDDMQTRGNDIAEFSVRGMFLISYSTSARRNAVAELKAIRDLRMEFHVLFEKDRARNEDPMEPSAATKEAANRLQNMYIVLNVDALLVLLDAQEDARLAA
jgi:hypothetical protein